MDNQNSGARRLLLQWIVLPLFIIVIGLGWKYTWMGYLAPVVMVSGILGAMFKSRYVCRTLCPRGSFFDRLLARISLNKSMPRVFRSAALRWGLLAFLMSFMIYQIATNPVKGYAFWLMCAATSSVGVVLGIIFPSRAWCGICPMGTLQTAIIGRGGQQARRAESCRHCSL